MSTAPPPKSHKTITFRFDAELFDRLAAAAEADRRSINSMAQILIEEGLASRPSLDVANQSCTQS
jgi:hypothetical protein